jgi:hypothetical protein
MMEKLQLESRAELVQFALKHGLLAEQAISPKQKSDTI